VVGLGQIWLIGVGTVFGTWVLIVLTTLVAGYFSPFKDDAGLGLFWVYAGVGGAIAALICMVLTIPMLALWFPIYHALIEAGLSPRRAAMTSASLLAFISAVGVVGFAQYKGVIQMPTIAWVSVLVPVLIAAMLARRVFSGEGEAGQP
jgi:hypothetical protein